MRGMTRANIFPTLMLASRNSRLTSPNRSFSHGSRAKALTTLIPARFSCSTVFSLPNLCWTWTNKGRPLLAKKANTISTTTITGPVISVSCQLVPNSSARLPVIINRALTNCTRPMLMNILTISTSLVARVRSCPVCALS